MGYQEMIYNYLGSKKDFIEKMRLDDERAIRILNPMTENHEYVRDSVLASLLISESVSAHSAFPHKIFEIGKVAYRKGDETFTRQYAGFLNADKDGSSNTISAQIQSLFYYIPCEYKVEETEDKRFITGRAATIVYKGAKIGVFGELHPEILENFSITTPCTAGEIDLDALL
jgi:phenylalanyl-tRNA synthetase beta chain